METTTFTPKPSRATQWWLGILAIVLIVLFLETRGTQHPGSNFFINSSAPSIGADVIVDGQKLGVIGDSQNSGLSGGAFWGHLTRGKHHVELHKSGFQPFSQDIDMHGEEYLGVDLKPLKN